MNIPNVPDAVVHPVLLILSVMHVLALLSLGGVGFDSRLVCLTADLRMLLESSLIMLIGILALTLGSANPHVF